MGVSVKNHDFCNDNLICKNSNYDIRNQRLILQKYM